MRDTLPLLEKFRSRRSAAAGSTRCRSMSAIAATSPACTATSMPGPNRTEEMGGDVADTGARIPRAAAHRDARHHRRRARAQSAFPPPGDRGARLGVKVMDRCNLTILEQPGQEDLAEFLAGEQVEIVASMPCYLEDNVERQRGKGVFDGSIRGLKRLNALGYGRDGSGLALNLVYNPQGPSLPPPQAALEADYKRVLGEQLRHRVQQTLHARQHADPALRLDADLQGRVRRLSRPAAARPSRRQSRRRDVPQPDLGRLARLSSTTATSTRCSTCR